MRRFLHQNSLFVALLLASAALHWAIGYLGGAEHRSAELWLPEAGKTTVSVQLVAPNTPPQPPVETLDIPQPSVQPQQRPQEHPQLDAPDLEMQFDPQEIRRLEQRQRAEFQDSQLVERSTDFQLPQVSSLELPTIPRESLEPIPLPRTAPRSLVEDTPIAERKPVELSQPPVLAPQLTQQPQQADSPEKPFPTQEDLPRRSEPVEPSEPSSVRLPANADRTLSSQGSSGVEAPPSVRTSRRPEYPRQMLIRGIEGLVKLTVEVTRDGKAGTVRVAVSSGHVELDQAAIVAARGYRFTPARRNGQTVATTVTLPVRFKIVK